MDFHPFGEGFGIDMQSGVGKRCSEVADAKAFAQALTKLDLVDEYRINVHPVAFGDGYKLFGGPLGLRRVEARTFPSGSVAYTYARS